MNRISAYRILAAELEAYRELPFAQLVQLVGQTSAHCVRDEDSNEYVVEVTIRRHERPRAEIVIEGWIADNDCGPLERLEDRFVVKTPSQ